MGTDVSPFSVEFLQPSSLAREAGSEAAFLNCWDCLPIKPRAWRAYSLLPQDGGLFIKGLRVPLLTRTKQHWRRRWDIHREMNILRRLQGRGLPVTVLVAWGCESRAGLPLRSFPLLRGCTGALNLSEFIRRPGARDDRLAVFRAVGRMIAKVHDSGVRHGDLACRNVLVLSKGPAPEVMLVDFARSRLVRPGRTTADCAAMTCTVWPRPRSGRAPKREKLRR